MYKLDLMHRLNYYLPMSRRVLTKIIHTKDLAVANQRLTVQVHEMESVGAEKPLRQPAEGDIMAPAEVIDMVGFCT